MWLQIAKLSVKCFCYKHLLVISRNHMNPFPPSTAVTYSGQSCFFHVSFPEPLDPSFIQDEHLTHQDQSNFYGNLWLQIRFIHFLFEARADYPPKPGAVALVQVKRMCQCFDHCLKQFGYSKKNKQNYYMIQKFSFWVYTQKNSKQGLEQVFVYQHS